MQAFPVDSHCHTEMSTGSWLFHSHFILGVLKAVFSISLFSSAKLFSASSQHQVSPGTTVYPVPNFKSGSLPWFFFVFKSHSSTLPSLDISWTCTSAVPLSCHLFWVELPSCCTDSLLLLIEQSYFCLCLLPHHFFSANPRCFKDFLKLHQEWNANQSYQ